MSTITRKRSTGRTPARQRRRGTAASMKVAMWGNCLAVRIPKIQAQQTGLSVGTEVVVENVSEGVLIRPVRRRPTLKELVARITPKNRHGEIDLGAPVGREIL